MCCCRVFPLQPRPSVERLIHMSESLKKPADSGIGMSTVSARQAQSGLGVRYVLAISTFAAVAIMEVVYVLFFMS